MSPPASRSSLATLKRRIWIYNQGMSGESWKPKVYRQKSATAGFEPLDPLQETTGSRSEMQSAYPLWENIVIGAKVFDDLIRIGWIGYMGVKMTVGLGAIALALPSILQERARQAKENGGVLPYCEDVKPGEKGGPPQYCRIDWRRTGFGMLYDWARGEDGSVSTKIALDGNKNGPAIRIVIPKEKVQALEKLMAPDSAVEHTWRTEVKHEPASDPNLQKRAEHRRRFGR